MQVSRLVSRLVPGWGCCHWARVPEGEAGDAMISSMSAQARAKRADSLKEANLPESFQS